MAATGWRFFSALYFKSKRALRQHHSEISLTNKRHFLHRSWISTESKSTDIEKTVRGSFGFVEWQNGGGLFHKTAHIDPSVFLEVGAVVHQNVVIGADVHIGSGSTVGPSVTIGHSANIGYNTVLSNCSVGLSCVIHNGASIGQDGFGFYVDDDGNMMKKPQTLYVRIGDNVEIGANSCIDRGR